MADSEEHPGTFLIGEQTFEFDYSGQRQVRVTDRGGSVAIYQEFNGVLYTPAFKLDYLKQVQGFKMRQDDVYFPGYPRTGTNWTFEMTSMLLNGKAETIHRFKDHLELVSADDIEKLPSPRIINCHMKLSDAPDDVKRKKVKVIYTLQDPKDVAVSVYNMYYNHPLAGGKYLGIFGDFLQLFLEGRVDSNGMFEHIRDAEKFFVDNPDIPVHFQVYEETLKNPVASVQKLSDFLGLKRDDELCRAIAEKCSFSKMRSDKEKFSMILDGENLLYRKGISGDWRNNFTFEMLDEYYRVYEEKMAGSRFYGLYTRDKDKQDSAVLS